MPQCKRCQKKKLFLTVDSRGLCRDCQESVGLLYWRPVQIVKESMDIVERSKNIETKLSRIKVMIDNLDGLVDLERNGYLPEQWSPSKIKADTEKMRDQYIKEHCNALLLTAQSKSAEGKTLAGRTSPYKKAIEKIDKLYFELQDVSLLDIAKAEAQAGMDKATVDHYMEEADKAAFKGNTKKAIDQYLEALYAIKTDRVDDVLQAQEIEEIKEKIRALGGEVPASA